MREQLQAIDKNFEQVRLELESKLLEAQKAALPLEDAETLIRDNTPEALELLRPSIVVAETLVEYRALLELLGRSPDVVLDTLSHENAHSNIASSKGALHKGYGVFVMRGDSDTGYIYKPFNQISFPAHWTTEHRQAVKAAILRAPEVYGNSLSPDDRHDLRRLHGNQDFSK